MGSSFELYAQPRAGKLGASSLSLSNLALSRMTLSRISRGRWRSQWYLALIYFAQPQDIEAPEVTEKNAFKLTAGYSIYCNSLLCRDAMWRFITWIVAKLMSSFGTIL